MMTTFYAYPEKKTRRVCHVYKETIVCSSFGGISTGIGADDVIDRLSADEAVAFSMPRA
jgi:hypothetical protein